MSKVKKLIRSPRVIILLLAVLFMIFAIHPAPFNDGVVIKSVAKGSAAELAGFEGPAGSQTPLSRERILAINNEPVDSVETYHRIVSSFTPNQSVQIQTDKDFYRLTVEPIIKVTETNETTFEQVNETIVRNETVEVEKLVVDELTGENRTVLVNETLPVNVTVNKTVEVPVYKQEIIGAREIGLRVGPAPTSNLRKGLDLQGGTRVLLKPAEEVSDETLGFVIESTKQRLNVYGLSDLVVTEVRDRPSFLGEGDKFILVEIAGATEEEVQDLLAKQGKFEAKVGDATVFFGGDDITYVCRTAECSGLDSRVGCQNTADGQVACGYSFSISLSPEAAQRQAEATAALDVVFENGQEYLTAPLQLYLDNELVDELRIASDLKGRAVTDISISGSGSGASQPAAVQAALDDMKRLQTVLITGSLPVKLDIVKIDAISGTLGSQFIQNIFKVGLITLLAVIAFVFLVYRSLKIALPMALTLVCEIIIILGVSALFGQFLDLDLAAIAGLIVIMGTGLDHQIVIADEIRRGSASHAHNWAAQIKRAFFIIMAAYFTTLVAMIPLIFAGAGLLKGFAITTIVGVSVGVFITRPAFASIVKVLLQE